MKINYIQYFLRQNSSAFSLFLNQLSNNSTRFYLNNYSILEKFNNIFFFNINKNFRKSIKLNIINKFIISLK